MISVTTRHKIPTRIQINPRLIAEMSPTRQGTKIVMDNGMKYSVKETIAELHDKMLEEANDSQRD